MSQKTHHKKVYAFVTFTNSTEKIIEIWNVTDAKIDINKFHGDNLFDDVCDVLLEMKKKNLEGIFFDLFEHGDSEFLVKLRSNFMEFCRVKKILYRWIFRDILFSTMLLYFSEENFKTEDTVITLWIKNDNFIFHKYHDGYLTQIDRIKIKDERFEKKFDKIVKVKEPKFVVMGSTTVLKDVKVHLQAKEVKMVKNTFLQCLQKSAGYLLGQMLRSQKCRWNFKVQLFNAFKIEVKSGAACSSISSGAIDSLSFQSTLNFPKIVTCFKGSTKFLYGRHFSFHNEAKVSVEVDEDGFVHFMLPKMYQSFYYDDVATECISYKNGAYMEDFIYITTSDSDRRVLEAWTIVNHRLVKKEFAGDNVLKDMNVYLMKLRKISLDAIVFNLYQHSDPEFIWTARRHFKLFCDRQRIRFKFITEESLLLSFLLLKSKINLSRALTISIGYVLKSKLKFVQINTSANKIEITETVEEILFNEMSDILTHEHDYFIFSITKEHPMQFLLEMMFSMAHLTHDSNNMKMIKDDFEQCFTSVSTSFFLQMFNSKNSKWNLIAPTSPCSGIYIENEDDYEYPLFDQHIQSYPCAKIVPIPRNALRLHVDNDYGNGYIFEYPESNKNKIMLDVSEDGFTHFCVPSKFAAFDGGSKIYKEFAKKLNAVVSNRKPVILFTEDIAILFVYENRTYSTIEIDGRKEIRAVINFAEDDPVFGNPAMYYRINEDSSVVVYDILEVIKMDPNKIVKKDKWDFNIVRYGKYPILFEFETSEGTTHAPPSFLLAMMIKRLAKEYKEKIGHKLKDIMVPDIYLNKNALKHVKEAFELENTKCTFFKL